jgi:hypothetical protein
MAVADSIAMNYYLTMPRAENPLRREVEGYISTIQKNLKEGFYSPETAQCIADANLRYVYSCAIIPMNDTDNKVLREFRNEVKKIALDGITCDELHRIVEGIEKKIY